MLKFLLAGFIYLGIRNIDMYYIINNTLHSLEFCRDYFKSDKDKEITVISLNINRLKTDR